MTKYILLLIFLFTFLNSTPLSIDSKENHYSKFQISYLKDQNNSSTIKTISNQNFKEATSNFALGYTKGKVWIKFDIVNNSESENFVLSLNESFYEKANLYYFDKNSTLTQKNNGLFVPIKSRAIYTNKIAFTLDIPKNTPTTLTLELQGKYAYFGDITLSKKNAFHPYSLVNFNTLYLLLFGICFLIIIFNIFLYYKVKEKIYAYYVAYSFFNLLYIANISGLLVYVDMQEYIYKLQLSASFMIGFLILFSSQILELKKYFPRFGKIVPYLSIPAFFFGIMILFSYQPWNKFVNNYAALVSLFLIVLSAMVYFKGNKKSKYYIFALMSYFFFAMLFAIMVTGIIEYSFITRYGFVLGTTVEIIIFSLILANRYYEMQTNLIESQKKLIEIKTRNEIFLENEVKQRTSQLEDLLDEREMLIKEVHHRVKNNFHTLLGLLWMEEQKETPDNEKFENIRNRIKAMSMIHEKLYDTSDLQNIDIQEYIEEIINNLTKQNKMTLKTQIEPLTLGFDTAISLGIIINELIANSLKHNKNNKNLYIKISLTHLNNHSILRVSDNGIGFDMNAKNEDGLGMSIIESFSKKIPNATYTFKINNGVIFELIFSKEGDE